MKQFFIKLFKFICSLFVKKEKIKPIQPIEYSYLPQLTIKDIKVRRYDGSFHLNIYFPFEEKDDIEKIIINVKGDPKETGYIQCSHLTYDEETKIQPLCGSYLPATFELQVQHNILNLDYEPPFFIMVDMISRELDIDIQLISKKGDYYFFENSEIKHIHYTV